jgi:hypothetical protein
VFEHWLEIDGSASIELRYFSVAPTRDNSTGFEQVLELKSGLSMGSESGASGSESVALGLDHELVFHSYTFG